MAERNGDRDSRMDRMERQHEQFQSDLKQLLIAQVIQKEQIDQLLKVTQEHTRQLEQQTRQLEAEGIVRREKDAVLDARVDNLVSAIGDFISRLPAK
jgi:hypothetical protein